MKSNEAKSDATLLSSATKSWLLLMPLTSVSLKLADLNLLLFSLLPKLFDVPTKNVLVIDYLISNTIKM